MVPDKKSGNAAYLLKDAKFSPNFPPAELPARENILEVVVHSNDKEEIPSLESLLEDSHLTESTTTPTSADKDRRGGFSLDEDLRAHGDTATETTTRITEEPVLRYRETRMFMESLFQELDIPQ